MQESCHPKNYEGNFMSTAVTIDASSSAYEPGPEPIIAKPSTYLSNIESKERSNYEVPVKNNGL